MLKYVAILFAIIWIIQLILWAVKAFRDPLDIEYWSTGAIKLLLQLMVPTWVSLIIWGLPIVVIIIVIYLIIRADKR